MASWFMPYEPMRNSRWTTGLAVGLRRSARLTPTNRLVYLRRLELADSVQQAIRQGKIYARRYPAEATCRFNRRFRLRDLLPQCCSPYPGMLPKAASDFHDCGGGSGKRIAREADRGALLGTVFLRFLRKQPAQDASRHVAGETEASRCRHWGDNRRAAQASLLCLRISRCFSRFQSRSLLASRLSWVCLPFASASSTFTLLPFQYSAVGTSV